MDSIIWDWNGTLLNDLDLCISAINVLLKRRGLPLLDQYSYKEAFSFPVKDYYRTIGFDFDKENFSIPAKEFIESYNKQINHCPLHSSAHDILILFQKRGYRQFVLSAMKQTMLEQTLRLKNIFDYFEAVAGLNDHYAVSKIERGRQLLEQNKIMKRTAWMIGDTDHDHEVARALGINCILIADGHQSQKRLKETGATVLNSLNDLINNSFQLYR